MPIPPSALQNVLEPATGTALDHLFREGNIERPICLRPYMGAESMRASDSLDSASLPAIASESAGTTTSTTLASPVDTTAPDHTTNGTGNSPGSTIADQSSASASSDAGVTQSTGEDSQFCKDPMTTECGHTFGKACIGDWYLAARRRAEDFCCPFCRSVLLDAFLPATDEFIDQCLGAFHNAAHAHEEVLLVRFNVTVLGESAAFIASLYDQRHQRLPGEQAFRSHAFRALEARFAFVAENAYNWFCENDNVEPNADLHLYVDTIAAKWTIVFQLLFEVYRQESGDPSLRGFAHAISPTREFEAFCDDRLQRGEWEEFHTFVELAIGNFLLRATRRNTE